MTTLFTLLQPNNMTSYVPNYDVIMMSYARLGMGSMSHMSSLRNGCVVVLSIRVKGHPPHEYIHIRVYMHTHTT